MKKLPLLSIFCFFVSISYAQLQKFDIATYTAPGGWKKQNTESTIQFSKEDAAKGTYCLITWYKAIQGTANSKENFDLAWTTIVKDMVTVSTAPEMQPVEKENGWEIQSGYSPFESDGNKGVVVLATSTGYEKMVNIIILTNSDVYEKEMTAFLQSIHLKKISTVVKKQVMNPVKPVQSNTGTKKDGFAFTTTNFDDGWNSTVQEDWVEVTKGNIKVLLHYPKEGTIVAADPEPHTNGAWNILVAPRYSNLKNYKTAYITTYDRPYLGMGYATDNATGTQVFVLLFRQGITGWIEVIAPDKNSFIQQYKFNPEAIQWDSETELLKPLVQMAGYNKFAVAAGDLKGAWTSDFTGVQQLYHVYTGNYAGMNIHQSNQNFTFGEGNTYNWELMVVNGMVGAVKYNKVKSAGKISVLNNWQIKFSDIEGKPKVYHAFFSCIKGARLLKLLDAQYPGGGIYDVYGKK